MEYCLWNTSFFPLFALDVSFCPEFRHNCFKYFWKCHLSFFSFSHFEVSLTKAFHTHKYEMDWFLWKFQNCYFKSIRKLLSFKVLKRECFESFSFSKFFVLWRKMEPKLYTSELTFFCISAMNSMKTVLWMQYFFFLSHDLLELKLNQYRWLDLPQH